MYYMSLILLIMYLRESICMFDHTFLNHGYKMYVFMLKIMLYTFLFAGNQALAAMKTYM